MAIAQFTPSLVDVALPTPALRQDFARAEILQHFIPVRRALQLPRAMRAPVVPPANRLLAHAREAVSKWADGAIEAGELALELGAVQQAARRLMEQSMRPPGAWALQQAIRHISAAFRKRTKGVRKLVSKKRRVLGQRRGPYKPRAPEAQADPDAWLTGPADAV
jgi:hypothetical protein